MMTSDNPIRRWIESMLCLHDWDWLPYEGGWMWVCRKHGLFHWNIELVASPMSRRGGLVTQPNPTYATVMLACNDEGGNWSGRVDGVQIEIGEDEWSLEGDTTLLQIGDHTLRFGGHFFLDFLTGSYTTWVGNWCWDQVRCTDYEARRLLNYLRLRPGWIVTSESHPVESAAQS